MTTPAIHLDDPLAPWLESLKPSAGVFSRAVVGAPWGLAIEARETATFHLVSLGSAILELDAVAGPIQLRQGDLVLLPKGSAHRLIDAPVKVHPLPLGVEGNVADGTRVELGVAGDSTAIVCGECRLGVGRTGLVDSLPAVLRHRCEPALVRLMDDESKALAEGGEAVLSQLLVLLVMQALRAHFASRGAAGRRTLVVPSLSRVLDFIHRNFADDIQLEDLCAVGHISKSVLSEKFREALGTSPIRYLRATRLARARELLRAGTATLDAIASAVGYRSASTLSRAFRREFGTSPGALRRSNGRART